MVSGPLFRNIAVTRPERQYPGPLPGVCLRHSQSLSRRLVAESPPQKNYPDRCVIRHPKRSGKSAEIRGDIP